MKFAIGVLLATGIQLAAAPIDHTVEDWNREFREAVRRQTPPPCLVARNLAILHLAMWRASEASSPENRSAAIAASAHEVSVTLFPGDRAKFDRLLTSSPDAPPEVVKRSRSLAQSEVNRRKDDGSTTTVHYQPDLEVGIWQRTTNNREPELPHWSHVRPFLLESAAEFRPPPPPEIGTESYHQDLAEVARLGGRNSRVRTKDQAESAFFWSDFSYTDSPPGRWNEIACQALEDRDMSIAEKARLFAILNLALADAGIAAWDCKFHYKFWRPVSAIRESMDDGDPDTVPNPNWKSLLPAPSHPEYVSGHSTFSGAGACVLSHFLGELPAPISIETREMPGVRRKFENFDDIANEIGRSRIYGGIHFESANCEGLKLGAKVARHTITRFEASFEPAEP
ncbi:vanadium-dependent haloperoxidase [Haloferula sp.]|uniref:vanadium-dependent haloperoxidase n=1 Tax=Haloferula sp. TaxID=2497595 RepID=UPI003C73C2C5